ncbi:thiamine pyrophosphate-dependent enzyme [Gordonia polyisoprenivorans]|uniref:thiamine pyrophosphate-dependent enzyme n=1 Tax=Gordonia polyisoprenivorans TaxID=84595 RepID=UPI0003779128|nr:thiamine pyrophosphate-dependent enzyme [Gordonia polyisoprenivorans]
MTITAPSSHPITETRHPIATPRTTAEVLVDGLVAHGVDTVFGIPGVQTYPLFEALGNASDTIDLITPRHEQTCAYMALGYAQSTGRLGVCSVVPGPGILNASAGLLTAMGTSTPVLALTGEIPSDYLGRGFGHVHEMPDQLATLRGVTKHAELLLDPENAATVLAESIRTALQGRPGPTAIATPWDVLPRQVRVDDVAPLEISRPAVDSRDIDAAAALIATARAPMILVGGGAREAGPQVRALAETCGAPVVAFRGGKGVVGDSSPYGFTCADGLARWPDTDLVIIVGSRAELLWFRWPTPDVDVPRVVIDIDPAVHTRLHPTVAITADARDATADLVDRLNAGGRQRVDRTTEFAAIKRRTRSEITEWLQPHADHLAAIRRAVPTDGYLVDEVSQMGFAACFGFPVGAPRHFITTGHQSTLGYGFPTALGVKAAHRDSVVVSVTGDGGFQFAIAELATAVQYRLGVVVVVFDNAAFGNVKADQIRRYGHAVGADLHNPDFAAVAIAYGAQGVRAESPEELEAAITAAAGRDVPTVVVVPMPLSTEITPWRYLMRTTA